jgi:hypothetical protein
MEKENNYRKFLDWMKILTNIFLIICFIIASFYYITNTKQVNEALGFKEPYTLIEIYENTTGKYCVCYNSQNEIKYNITP